ncbi:alpha/beta hydrolase [Streptomyces flaveolus]|uniref:alpha/beta hydrolase n=1 Tax=Streptomyces flaveolus TaxID=67297 RepID=UPI0034125456
MLAGRARTGGTARAPGTGRAAPDGRRHAGADPHLKARPLGDGPHGTAGHSGRCVTAECHVLRRTKVRRTVTTLAVALLTAVGPAPALPASSGGRAASSGWHRRASSAARWTCRWTAPTRAGRRSRSPSRASRTPPPTATTRARCRQPGRPGGTTPRPRTRTPQAPPGATPGSTRPCLTWPDRPGTPVTVDGTRVASALLVDGTDDAAIPFEGSLEVRARYAHSELVAVDGGVDHGGTPSGNPCVDGAIARCLADGTLPTRRPGREADQTCTPLPDPEPLG